MPCWFSFAARRFHSHLSLTFSGMGTSGSGSVPTVTDKTGAVVNLGTATTISFTNGVSDLGGLLVAYKAETATLQVTDGTYSTTTTGGSGVSLTITGLAASRLGFSTQPDKAEVGAVFLQQPVVQTQDTYGNPTTSGLGASLTVTVSISAGSGLAGTLGGTTTLDIGTGAGNGTATFTDLKIDGDGQRVHGRSEQPVRPVDHLHDGGRCDRGGPRSLLQHGHHPDLTGGQFSSVCGHHVHQGPV